MEIYSVEFHPSNHRYDEWQSTFVLKMQTSTAVIHLECKVRKSFQNFAQISLDLMQDAMRQLSLLPEIASGKEKIFFDHKKAALKYGHLA